MEPWAACAAAGLAVRLCPLDCSQHGLGELAWMFGSGQKSNPEHLSWGFRFLGSFADCRVGVQPDREVQEMEYGHPLRAFDLLLLSCTS